jgi:hypothetical protein
MRESFPKALEQYLWRILLPPIAHLCIALSAKDDEERP